MLKIVKKNEPLPVMKAGIRLLYKIFSGAMDASEFQRQVSIPNVPKMTAAIIALVEKHTDLEFKVCRIYLWTGLESTNHRCSSCQ